MAGNRLSICGLIGYMWGNQPMGDPTKFKKLEMEYQKPIEEILVEKLNTLGNIAEVARDIDISYDKVFHKIKKLGIRQLPARWEMPEPEHAD